MSDERVVRWLHLSDFHVGKDEYAQRRIFDKIHDHVRERLAAWAAPDLVLITGDLAQSGKFDQYSMFYDEFLLPLLEVFGDDWRGKAFTVPGNHDVDLDRNQAFSRDEILRSANHYFDPTDQGKNKRELLIPRFEAYARSEQSDSPATWLNSTAGGFSRHLVVRGCKIEIAGVNTAWLCKDKGDRHHLTPGLDLVETALKGATSSDVCVVLGHHPLNWLHDEHEDSLRAILGKHHAIYLHGHLHKEKGRREDGAGHGFLAIQAGACFQARDDEPWVNGLLWGELDLERNELRLQPRHWNPANHDWPITSGTFPESRRREGTDWWCFPLPGSERGIVESEGRLSSQAGQTSLAEMPEGWQLVDPAFLELRRKEIVDQEVLRFFDGSTPSWALALSSVIPRRAVVGQLADWLSQESERQPRVALLVGPGGEGKSTAFFQVIATLLEANPSWKVLWRHNEYRSLTRPDLSMVDGERWLIATDDASLITQDLFTLVKSLQVEERGDVTFFLTCRDTDWRAASGDILPWSMHSCFLRKELSGLNLEDARQIVHAWSQYGPEGLGQLAGEDEGKAAQSLFDAATKEAELKEGAFFGAMLRVRIGDALREHLKTLLDRLGGRNIQPGVTLLDGFAFIAAMHAEGLVFLSKPVLAEALGCSLSDIKPKVIGPLGKEAAAVGAGRFVLTRHRTIAKASVDILSETFNLDMDPIYLDLARAAIAAHRVNDMPEIRDWRFEFSQHFLNGRPDLALRIGRIFLDASPSNIRIRVHLSTLYRKAGMPDEAARLFRGYAGALNRKAWFEWGVAEGEGKNDLVAAWLEAIAIADQAGGPPPENQSAKQILAGLGVAFGNLYDSFNQRIFIEGRGAVAALGLTLPLDSKAYRYFENHKRESQAAGVVTADVDIAFERFEAAAQLIRQFLDFDLIVALRVAMPRTLTFRGLHRLIHARLQK
jgi:3',5'-cyclic AMP phosphodiesterase CpdA